ncbi:phage antirepressor KilAC domain-containing protein [Sphaerotilus sp.]|uniref:phage antirepressor KilAC domain-containing protein n=1 Tax=Sphaerotilus sp. TaxID=2093942 RepID=UPI0025DC0727|nr:phage antirepressor KilAC domain-containing protein [Sphaerotilus sp.]
MTHRPATTTETAAALVTVADGQPVATTERIAEAIGQQHASVIKLIRKHLVGLIAAGGPIRFAVRVGRRGGAPVEYAELTQPHATMLMLLQRSTPQIAAAKVRLVAEFFGAAPPASPPPPVPALPADYSAALRALADAYDTSQRITLALAAAETRISDQAPAVAAQARLAGSDGSMSLTDAAKSLHIGPRAFAERLAALEWIYRRDLGDSRTGPWRARQTQINAGRMSHRVAVYVGRDGGDRATDQAMVTPAGMAKLAELLTKGATA